ncbi:MBL fold metallo-hydrolase [Mesobacterium pallidum]|uniref:MBL fold metallo-hydrolase n=1 Tax=Mesobacterium pallidum TaxID=2872037 RepID=UPI001EE1FF13|nr:MBL fold metallo-hydrolase [Mesobacterium pallidum]
MSERRNTADPVTLVSGRLYMLGDSEDIDARISWRAPCTHGLCEPFNVYLLRGEDGCILVEAGIARHRDRIASQLQSLLAPGERVERLAVTRNEPDTISNLPNLAAACGVHTAYTPGVINPFDFFDDASAHLHMKSFGVDQHPALPGTRIALGPDRWLEPVQTPLRLLSTIWYYDTGTRTLFTSDIFSSGTHPRGGDPLLRGVPDRATLYDRMRRHVVVKYDWLTFSNLTDIISDLETLFATYEVETLAPSRGCLIVGAAVVKQYQTVLLDVLRDLGRNRPGTGSGAPDPARQDQAVVATNRMIYSGFKTRDIGDGIHLLGGCFHARMYGKSFHSHGSAYLILGEDAALIVDTCHAKDAQQAARYLSDHLGDRRLYIFPTHEEYPHAGNLGGLLDAFPDAIVLGDVRNYHLYHPEAYDAGRFRPIAAGDRIDLGGRVVHALPAIIHDLPNTLWAWDDRSATMFVSDAFGFSHYETDECTLLSDELPTAPTVEDSKQVLDLALYWTRFAEKDGIIGQMEELFAAYPPARIAPAHGSVVTQPRELAELMNAALHATTR